jgi:uncharacterized membrane protein
MNEDKEAKVYRTDSGKQTDTQQETFFLGPERLSALSDGVIAIAITLLALELSIPILAGDQPDEPTSLWDMSGELYTYALGFFSLGIYWALHHFIFHFIRRADGLLVWLNIVFLAFASLAPFWTAFNLENIVYPEAYAQFSAAQILTLLVLLAIWLHATKDNRLVSDNANKRVRSGFSRIILVGVGLLILSAILGAVSMAFAGILSLLMGAWFVYGTTRGYRSLFRK